MAKSKSRQKTTQQVTTGKKQGANTQPSTSVSELPGIGKVWPESAISPDDPTPMPSVVLVFHGLTSFINFGETRCDVGFHNQNSDHELTLFTGLFGQPFDYLQAIPISNLANTEPFTFKITPAPPSIVKRVTFFQDREIFRRDSANDHRKDFRWLLDFEGPEFYHTPLKLKTETLTPTLSVYDGLFYTLFRTDSTFKRKATDGEFLLGNIAYMIAANVYLDDDSVAILRIGKHEMDFKKRPGLPHVLFFVNSCPREECSFDPRGPRKESRNDFYMYYRTFEIPSGRPEYELVADHIVGGLNLDTQSLIDSKRGPFNNSLVETILGLLSTDPAPCGGGGGHSGG